MKEARLIVPLMDNDGMGLKFVHDELENLLVNAFGGFTAIDAIGGWKGPQGKVFKEPVVLYDIAVDMDNSDETDNAAIVRNKLRDIAAGVKRDARQEAIYLRMPDGQVEFI